MAKLAHTILSSVNPTNAPPRINMHWVNQVTKHTWYSVGTSSVTDWLLVNNGTLFYDTYLDLPITGISNVIYVVKADSLCYFWDGSTYISLAPPATQQGTQAEKFAGLCDGRTINRLSGTITLPNVTANQLVTTTYTTVSGSAITFTPPAGAKTLIYRFTFSESTSNSNAPILHAKLFVGANEVSASRISMSALLSAGTYFNLRHAFEFSLAINQPSENIADGIVGAWNTDRQLSLQVRGYPAYVGTLHQNSLVDGAVAIAFVRPHISIEAIY
jgi:hypothetical protein